MDTRLSLFGTTWRRKSATEETGGIIIEDFLRLPADPSGYGDFAASYVGPDARVQFIYRKDGTDSVGELYFRFCLSLLVNGEMNKQRELPYDKIMVAETGIGFDGSFHKYVFMLSGSDFQFEVISKSCSFAEDVKSGIFVEQ